MSLPDSLRDTELRPLWRAVHERLSSGRTVRGVRVGPLDETQRSRLADLLGRTRLPGEYERIALAELDTALLEVCGRDSRAVVSELVGPLDDQAARRKRHTDEATELWRWLAEHEVVAARPELADWVAQVRRNGLVDGSVSRTRELLGEALRVLAGLPGAGIPLPVLAERELGDPHALDDGTRVAGLVLRALAVLHGVPVPEYAEQRRELWERAGVAEDELSATVLVAGPVLGGHGTAARMLRVAGEDGCAVALTPAQLRGGTQHGGIVPAEGVTEVYVVENPAVLTLALRRFGACCPPMICVSGWPNSAAIPLLRELAAHGVLARYHGDFDGEGLRITGHLVERVGVRPWRMTTADYLAALAGSGEGESRRGGPAAGSVPDTPWDPELAGAVREHGVSVPEERVAETLLDELGRAVVQPFPSMG
ncbi:MULTISPECIES: TIGR02679 family protein [unclassified Actinopolyspora]|uniref:TIGR02679 family protein n=1 Tax=unclassified Actinopolyspora TaxID=2639451 RepID=UPI0013F6075A|nr:MULTISPECIES: TIGR02679 family protein [unclassified Actinopolyspora]NHD16209.1 TIGR02679 family protein [Actinopolyspora sp. BKK2]NHE75928.1 TIGR02679 family protein [Actinopolyspora sp. BKK1]